MESYDIVIAGSGCAGLSAALIAHSQGLRPIIVEKTGLIGGTTSYSGGVIWVPDSAQNRASGIPDSLDQMETYLDSTVKNPHEREARQVYLHRGAEAIASLEQLTGPLFYVRALNSPDYFPDLPGAQAKGRALTPLSCDGRILGKAFLDIRPPLPEMCLFGRQMLELMDVYHLLNAKRSLRSAWHAARMGLRDIRDRLFYRKYRRGIRLTGGNALVARLYKAVLDRNIPILRNAPIIDLIRGGDRIQGAVIHENGVRRDLHARCGVILATGGLPWSKDLRAKFMPAAPAGYSATCPASTGDGITVAMANGAQFDTANTEGAFWSPVSVGIRRDGSQARFPHLMADRAKPGLIAVNGMGKRFVNEAENYHDFVRQMFADRENCDGPVHLICDADFVRKYPFGSVPPLALDRRYAVRSGYLIEARTLTELAIRIRVDADALAATVARYNQDAKAGIDKDFGKGASSYNRYLGDANHSPNPCLAPIAKAPFYAIRIYAGDIGTTFGLAADVDSRVLDVNGEPIPGLYASGNDRNSIMAGFYPSGGITVGPALVFSYLAVMHAAKAAPSSAAPPPTERTEIVRS